MAELAPQVAGQDALQTQAATLAGQGIGSYQPYVTAADSALTKAGGLTGADAYKDFMSPYQKDVIDATLQDFDKQAATQRNQIGQDAMSSGAFGGARQGVMQSEYQSQSDLNRASLQARMLQQGYEQAQQGAQQRSNIMQSLRGTRLRCILTRRTKSRHSNARCSRWSSTSSSTSRLRCFKTNR